MSPRTFVLAKRNTNVSSSICDGTTQFGSIVGQPQLLFVEDTLPVEMQFLVGPCL